MKNSCIKNVYYYDIFVRYITMTYPPLQLWVLKKMMKII